MKIGEPRKVKQYQLYTVDGEPVYNFGRRHTLEAAEHRLPAVTTDNPCSPFNTLRAGRAGAQVGKACVWRHIGETEIMEVYL